jgi:hypothetical protein
MLVLKQCETMNFGYFLDHTITMRPDSFLIKQELFLTLNSQFLQAGMAQLPVFMNSPRKRDR